MMEREFEVEEIDYEDFEQEQEPEEEVVEGEILRVKSLILLAIFILPTILIVIEVLTGGVSGAITPSNIEPVLPPNQFPSVHF